MRTAKHDNKPANELFTAEELLERLVSLNPGLVDGEEDDQSGADTVETIALLLQNYQHLDALETVAEEARQEMERLENS